LEDGLVLPEEGAPLLGVALVAGLVERALDEQVIGRRAVHVVAVGAVDAALLDRMRRQQEGLRTHVGMAAEAHLGLVVPHDALGADVLVEERAVGRVDLVARGASDGLPLVGAAAPVDALAAPVTAEADGGLLARGPPIAAESHRRRLGRVGDVGGARAVAGLASGGGEGRARVALHGVGRLQGRSQGGLVVAGETELGTAIGVLGAGGAGGGRRSGGTLSQSAARERTLSSREDEARAREPARCACDRSARQGGDLGPRK